MARIRQNVALRNDLSKDRGKTSQIGTSESHYDESNSLKVKTKTIRVLLDTGLSGDLLFIQKGKLDIPIVKRAVPQSELSFLDYSTSKRVRVTPNIVEYSGNTPPMYDLILGKQSLHDLGVILDFKEKTITIDEILLPMRNIARLQLEPSVSRALRLNTCQAQEPVSTRTATKRVVEILDAKYEKADLPAIIRENCSHLKPSEREKLLEPTADLLRIERGYHTISRQTIPHSADTQGDAHEGDRPALLNRGSGMATIIKMGLPHLHNTEEGWNSAYNIRFQGT